MHNYCVIPLRYRFIFFCTYTYFGLYAKYYSYPLGVLFLSLIIFLSVPLRSMAIHTYSGLKGFPLCVRLNAQIENGSSNAVLVKVCGRSFFITPTPAPFSKFRFFDRSKSSIARCDIFFAFLCTPLYNTRFSL